MLQQGYFFAKKTVPLFRYSLPNILPELTVFFYFICQTGYSQSSVKLMTEKMISQQQENSGRNHQNHIFCDQHPDYHPNPYEKQHKAEQLFQFFCTFFIGLL